MVRNWLLGAGRRPCSGVLITGCRAVAAAESRGQQICRAGGGPEALRAAALVSQSRVSGRRKALLCSWVLGGRGRGAPVGTQTRGGGRGWGGDRQRGGPPRQPLKQLNPRRSPRRHCRNSQPPRGRLPFLRLGPQARNSVTFALAGKWKLPAAGPLPPPLTSLLVMEWQLVEGWGPSEGGSVFLTMRGGRSPPPPSGSA